MLACMRAQSLQSAQLFVTPWTLAGQTPLSLGFPRQEYWSGLLFPPPGDLPDPDIESLSLVSPALIDGSGKPWREYRTGFFNLDAVDISFLVVGLSRALQED